MMGYLKLPITVIASEAKQSPSVGAGRLPRRSAPRNDGGWRVRPVRQAINSVCAILLALMLIAPATSNAALVSAQELTAACSGDAKGRAACDGYLMAVADTLLLRESRGRTGGKVCLPETVTLDQVRAAVLNVAQRPRAARAPSGVMLVMMAMRVTWPCNDQQDPRNGAPPRQ
jgi:hypothetical protein